MYHLQVEHSVQEDNQHGNVPDNLAPLPSGMVPKDVPPARANHNNDIIVEPIDDANNGSNVDVTQAKFLDDEEDNSYNNRKMPARKNKNNGKDDSNNNRKLPACKNNINEKNHNDNAEDDDEEVSYYDAE